MAETYEDLLKALKKLLEDNKDNVDTNGVPLSGSDLTDYDNNADEADTTAGDAMAKPYLEGLDPPTEMPIQGGGSTPFTDALALFAAQTLAKYEVDQDRQGQLDRLYTITQKYTAAKNEVD